MFICRHFIQVIYSLLYIKLPVRVKFMKYKSKMFKTKLYTFLLILQISSKLNLSNVNKNFKIFKTFLKKYFKNILQ